MPRALIVGYQGQDGTLLTRLLREKGYEILGIGRHGVAVQGSSFTPPGAIDITKATEVSGIIGRFRPREVYYLAAVHQSSEESRRDPVLSMAESYQVHVSSLQNFLEAIRNASPETRLFYAASSQIFGWPSASLQDEASPIFPANIYGITKAAGLFLCEMYRRAHGLHISVGILFNHESPLRGDHFISRKIILGARRCRDDPDARLVLGDLSSRVDWGYAPDYVAAMHLILSLPAPDTFIIATGETHTVREFVQLAFDAAGLDWKDFVEVRPEIIKETRPVVAGNPGKLKRMTGWSPSMSFQEMVRLLFAEGR